LAGLSFYKTFLWQQGISEIYGITVGHGLKPLENPKGLMAKAGHDAL
jgi:hypothetical protein